MGWDDLRFVLAVSRAGSLTRAARALGVDHTTVGRRIEAAEAALRVRLFTRTPSGYVPTGDGARLLEKIRGVEDAVLALERGAHAQHESIEGTVRITSPETFGVRYLAPRLASLGRSHPALTIELVPGGAVLDLARREADIAVRHFRSKHDDLVVRRVADVGYGLYASEPYLARRAPKKPGDLREHPLLTTTPGPGALDAAWLARLAPGVRPAFVSELTIALVEAARVGAGIAVLPCYVGDAEPSLRHLPMPDPPKEPVWITVHRDVRASPRVRVVLDFLAGCLREDRAVLLGSRR